MRATKRKNSNCASTTSAEPRPVPVRFEFESPTANSVCLAGTFNDWNSSGTEMIRDGTGRWVKEMALPPGAYEYRFVVDGEWADDPQAVETAPNPFGRLNSVLRVCAGAEHTGPADQ